MSKRILHFDCLDSDQISHFLNNLSQYTCKEKIDGYSLVLGADDEGQYIRQVHTLDKSRNHRDIDKMRVPNTYRRVVLKFLETIPDLLLQPEARVEILFGTTPNVVSYSSVSDDELVIVDLGNALRTASADITIDLPDLDKPGEFKTSTIRVSIRKINPEQLTLGDITLLTKNEEYLTKWSHLMIAGFVYSVADAAKLKLTHLPKDPNIRKLVEHARHEVSRVREESYMRLISATGKMKSSFGADFVEGWVFTSDSGQFKVVNRSQFLPKKAMIWDCVNKTLHLSPLEKKKFLQEYVPLTTDSFLLDSISRKVKEGLWELAAI